MDNQSVTVSMNPWAPLLHWNCFARVQYLWLHCSKIDKITQQRLELLVSWKTDGNPSVLHILHQTLTYMCVEKEEKKNLGLPVFFFPSTRCCLFLCGAVSFPGVASAPLR